jgi:hypothetical protein
MRKTSRVEIRGANSDVSCREAGTVLQCECPVHSVAQWFPAHLLSSTWAFCLIGRVASPVHVVISKRLFRDNLLLLRQPLQRLRKQTLECLQASKRDIGVAFLSDQCLRDVDG